MINLKPSTTSGTTRRLGSHARNESRLGDTVYAEVGGEATEAEIGLRLSRGESRAHVYFADLGHEYVTLNAEYTT